MGRRFGSQDSYKRNTENYKGRLPDAKDLDQRDGFKVWLYYQDKDLSPGERLNPEFEFLFWRLRYLYEMFGVMRPKRRRRFKVFKRILWMQGTFDDIFSLASRSQKQFNRLLKSYGYSVILTQEQIAEITVRNQKIRAVSAVYEKELAELEAKAKAFTGKVWLRNDTN